MFKKLGTIGLNGLMTLLLLGLLVMPLSSIGLAGIKPNNLPNNVLSAQDIATEKCTCPKLVITSEMEREIYERILKEEQAKTRESTYTNELEEFNIPE
jgi:hypothetical protein